MRLAMATGLVTLFLHAGVARADEVLLATGAVLTGEATRVGNKVRVRMDIGVIMLDADEVSGIRESIAPISDFLRRKANTNHADVSAMRSLAEWAEAQGLTAEAHRVWSAIVAQAPNDARAHERLGHHLHQGKWLDDVDWHLALGHVRWGSEWIPEQEAIAREEQRRRRREIEMEQINPRWTGNEEPPEVLLDPASDFAAYQPYLEAMSPLYLGPNGHFIGTYYWNAPSYGRPPVLVPPNYPSLPLPSVPAP